MSENNDFYKKFDSDFSKHKKSSSSFFISFISGFIGAALAIGLIFAVPNIRKHLIAYNPSDLNNSNTSNFSNNEIIDHVSLKNFSDTAVFAANKVLPSIVGIKVEYTVTSSFMPGLSSHAEAEGSGIIISTDGYILTNNHLITSSDSSVFYEVSEAAKVYVYLYEDETPYEAKIIGADDETDLAVIKIDKEDLTVAELGNSDLIKIGEFAMAIGNPLGMQSSVTSGIISAINRNVTSEDGLSYNLIQTDAAINSGNSGGALVNSEGKVIGLNTLKLSGTGIEGMGFAIPINETIDIYKELISNGKILRPYIGISGIDLDETTAKYYNLPVGVYIKQINPNSPASSSDLKPGDVITAIQDTKITNMEELNKFKNTKNIGDEITLKIYRNEDKSEKNIKIVLGEKP